VAGITAMMMMMMLWFHCRHDDKGAMLMQGKEEFRPVNHRCWDIEQRVTDMNTDNIDVQIISNTPILFQYHRPLAEVDMHYCFICIVR
jgi:aminocarboxymuconate-semialdehyde decarboxylase